MVTVLNSARAPVQAGSAHLFLPLQERLVSRTGVSRAHDISSIATWLTARL